MNKKILIKKFLIFLNLIFSVVFNLFGYFMQFWTVRYSPHLQYFKVFLHTINIFFFIFTLLYSVVDLAKEDG